MKGPTQLEIELKKAAKDFALSHNAGNKVVSDMSELVDVTDNIPLSNLLYWARLMRISFYNASGKIPEANWKFWQKKQERLTWIDVISLDGYRREKALRTLNGAAPNCFFFILVLYRLNDWVPQVRAAARDCIPNIVQRSEPQLVADALSVILINWNAWGRLEQSDKDVLLEVISVPQVANALRTHIMTSNTGPIAFFMSQVNRTSVLDKDLSAIAKGAVQPLVRAKAYRSLFESRVSWFEGREFEWTDKPFCKGRFKPVIGERTIHHEIRFVDLLTQSAEDSSSIVRRVAAEFLIREMVNLGEESINFARQFAKDKSPAVAERGKFALKKLSV